MNRFCILWKNLPLNSLLVWPYHNLHPPPSTNFSITTRINLKKLVNHMTHMWKDTHLFKKNVASWWTQSILTNYKESHKKRVKTLNLKGT